VAESPPLPSIVTWYSFSAEIRGTNLPALFAGAPPRVVLPDGKGELTLEYSATTGTYQHQRFGENPFELAQNYPDGDYRILLPDQAIRRRDRRPGGFPGLPVLQVERRTAARPVTVGMTAAGGRIRLKVVAKGIAAEVEVLADASTRAQLAVPPFTLPTGDTSARGQHERLTFGPRVVSLGRLGSPQVEAGYYSAASSQWFHFEGVSAPEKLANLSTRGTVPAGGDLTAGFVVSAGGPKMVLVRAVGPALPGFGVGGALANPVPARLQRQPHAGLAERRLAERGAVSGPRRRDRRHDVAGELHQPTQRGGRRGRGRRVSARGPQPRCGAGARAAAGRLHGAGDRSRRHPRVGRRCWRFTS
jgi:hypothetical protein